LLGKIPQQKFADGNRAVAGRGGGCCMRPGASNVNKKRGSIGSANIAAHLGGWRHRVVGSGERWDLFGAPAMAGRDVTAGARAQKLQRK